MDIQLADKLAKKLNEVEQLLIEVENEIGDIAPDSKSSLAAKYLLLHILNDILQAKNDIATFRDGESIVKNNPFAKQKPSLGNFDISQLFKNMPNSEEGENA